MYEHLGEFIKFRIPEIRTSEEIIKEETKIEKEYEMYSLVEKIKQIENISSIIPNIPDLSTILANIPDLSTKLNNIQNLSTILANISSIYSNIPLICKAPDMHLQDKESIETQKTDKRELKNTDHDLSSTNNYEKSKP